VYPFRTALPTLLLEHAVNVPQDTSCQTKWQIPFPVQTTGSLSPANVLPALHTAKSAVLRNSSTLVYYFPSQNCTKCTEGY
jgi:hypothetical protein